MIVYYNPETFAITGMSHVLNAQLTDPWFETDDPLALDIFLGKEKILKYVVVIRPGSNRGVIKLKPSKGSVLVSASDRVYKIPKTDVAAELKIKQTTADKTIELQLLEDSKNWWANDVTSKEKKLYLVATLGDPYKPLWIKVFSHADFDTNIKFTYQGTDDVTFYTPKLFYSYSHEIEPC